MAIIIPYILICEEDAINNSVMGTTSPTTNLIHLK